VNEGPGEDPDPLGCWRTRLLHEPKQACFVTGLSPSGRIGFSPEAIRPVGGLKRRDSGSIGYRESGVNRLNRQPDQRREGRRGAERPARPECPEGRAAERLPEAGACPPTRKPARTPPTGGKGAIVKAVLCGAVAAAVAVYILHLRESTPRSDANHWERRLAGDFR